MLNRVQFRPFGPSTVTPSADGSSSAKEVDDQNHQPHDQEQVNQAAANMQAEPQEPQDQQNNQNCPKHGKLLSIIMK
jgi:hypothetical protein